MTSSAFWAYGSVLQVGDGASPEVFTAVAEITELKPPNMSRDNIEVTTHSSSDGYREFIPGLRDGGEVSGVANWLPTNATHDEDTGILETFNDDELHNWRIVLPDTLATISFAGFLTAFEPDLPLDGQGKLSFTIKISGKATVAS
jgi:predicted secreted protein